MHTYRRSVKFILCLPSEWCFPLKHWTQICPFETSVRPLLSPKCVLSVGFPHCAELAPTDLVLGFCPISSIGLQLHLRNKWRRHGHCANGDVLSAEAPRPWEKMSITVFSSVQMFKPREISDSILCNATCYESTGDYARLCDLACVWSRSAGSKDQRLAVHWGRKQDTAALNFEKSEKERVTRLNTYTQDRGCWHEVTHGVRRS